MKTLPTGLVKLALLAMSILLATGPTSAQRPQYAGAENFDVRTSSDAAADTYMRRFAARASSPAVDAFFSGQSAGLARLETNLQADVVASPELGTPELVTAQPGFGFLTGPNTDRVGAMRAFLSSYADAYGLSQQQAGSLVLVADYVNPSGNMAWVELEQRINGLPVFGGMIRGGFTAKGELARTTGSLASDVDPRDLPIAPALSAAQAVERAAGQVGFNVAANQLVLKSSAGDRSIFARGPMADDAKAWLLYFPLAPGVVRLAWATEIWGDPEAYLILLDAADGTLLFRKNLTEYQSQAATYNVYKDDSPAPLSPSNVLPGTGTQAPFIGRTTETLIGNEAPNTFNSLGWLTDGTNRTDGNNVEAGIDRDGVNGVDVPVDGANRVFNFTYDPQVDSPLTASYQNGEVTDTFYWVNTYHDRLYLLGFNEAARNFQNDNFGRGGVALDRISAEAQDSSGTNNANFSTPSDGGRGRMQMYIFTGAVPNRSSGLDHDVLIHELTHGTSNRLHNNAAGLTTTMSRSMGEGWSDFYARALLSSASEDVNGIYPSGAWLTYQFNASTSNYYYGIRRFPYAVMSNVGANGRPHNPLTFADIDATQIDATDGAFPRNPFSSNTAFEVHNAGEVWCMALLEVRARFIARLGFAAGNQRVLQFITDGMKLDPVNPTFLQGRDSILAAAAAGGGTIGDLTDIWSGFAVRGMGFSAQILNAGSGSVVEAFDLPGLQAGSSTLVLESIPNGRIDAGESITASLCVLNSGLQPTGSLTGTLLAAGGVATPSAPQSFGALVPGAGVCRDFSFTASASCGATLTATLDVAESGGPTKSLKYNFSVGSQVSYMAENFDGILAPGLPSGWTTSTLSGLANAWVTNTSSAHTIPNRAFAVAPASVSDSVLVSPAIAVPAGLSRLTFQHLYATSTSSDGGVLEIAIAGGAFQDILDAGGTFLAGGYNGTISTVLSSPIAGRKAWTGASGTYVTTTVQMPPAAGGQNVALRWRIASDILFSGTGWAVDTIDLTSSRCGAATVPTITSLLPGAATPSSTFSAVLTGSDLFGASAVTFSGSGVTAVIENGGTPTTLPITVSVAAGADLGLHTVTVTTPNGTSSAFGGLIVSPPPAITAITPNRRAQGNTFSATIAGANLTGAYAVTFTGTGVTAVVESGGTATSLPITISIASTASLGLRTLTVTTLTGTSPSFSGLTVASPPLVTSMGSSSGPQAGTMNAVIFGANLTSASAVTFSGVGVTASIGTGGTFSTLPITISIAPGAALGVRTFYVTIPDGTSLPFPGFTVTSPPTISFTPANGPAGTEVTISGKNWSTATAVRFNGVPAASFTVVRNDVQLLTNTGFESGDLTGWTRNDIGPGTFYAATGTLTPGPFSFVTVGPRSGTYYAVSNMTTNSVSALSQPFSVSSTATRATLSFSMFVNDQDSGPFIHPAGLDHTALPNQHARVDILSGAATPFDTGSGVLGNFYLNVDPRPNPNAYRNYSFDITDLVSGGGSFQVRFAEVNNQLYLNMGIDDVAIVTESTTVRAIVPAAATTGPISMTTPQGIVISSTNFTAQIPAPTLTTMAPPNGVQGTSFTATLIGTNLNGPGLLIDAGAGITVTNVNVLNSTILTATFSVAAGAALGSRNVTVMTAGGSASLPFTVLPPPPTLTNVNPATGFQGTATSVTLTGTNLVSPTITVSGTGVTVSNVVTSGTTSATATFAIAATAAATARNVTVTTAGGTSGAQTFTVLVPPPALTSISPNAGIPGRSFTATFSGTSFLGAVAIEPIADIAVTNITVVSPTSVTATFTIAANAPLGPRSVMVTTPYGTSGALTFTVADPFPDLAISSTHTGNFGVGFKETYTVTVSNVGEIQTTGPITVNDTLPAGLTFDSWVGTDWTCQPGPPVLCQKSAALANGASSSFTLTVAVGSAAAGSVVHAPMVSEATDANTANNTAMDQTTVVAAAPAISFNPSPLTAGQQAMMAVTMGTPFPHDVTGSVTVTFVSDAALPIDDPSIKFANSSRTVPFTVSANATQARFGSATQAGPVGLQAGTVSGTLTFTGTFVAGTVTGSFSATQTIPRLAPAISNLQTSNQNGFAALISLSSTSREVTQVSLTFNTAPAVRLSCGGMSGCTVSGRTLTLNVASMFAAWFNSPASQAVGSVSTLRMPFTIEGGAVSGTVSVTLHNSQGVSNSLAFPLP